MTGGKRRYNTNKMKTELDGRAHEFLESTGTRLPRGLGDIAHVGLALRQLTAWGLLVADAGKSPAACLPACLPQEGIDFYAGGG